MKDNLASPPKWAVRFLRAICPDHLCEEIEGDLIQTFTKEVKVYGIAAAKRRFVWRAIRFFRPGIILRNNFSIDAHQLSLSRNYFKTTYRHIQNSKLNFAFKLGGLVVTLFSFLVIAIYVSFQFSFDRFNDGYENIYRVNTERKENGEQGMYAVAPLTLGPMMVNKIPELPSFTRFRGSEQRFIKYDRKVFSSNIPRVDSSFFNVFSFRFTSGSKKALSQPNSIVLTKSLADKIFGEEEPLNKLVTLTNGNKLVKVTAVIEDFPKNSHLVADALIPITDLNQSFTATNITSPVDFVDQSTILYLRFRNKIDPKTVASKLESLVDAQVGKKLRLDNGVHFSLQPLSDLYLSPQLKYEFTRKGSMFYIYAFSILGFFLLIIGSVNYINLSIADFNNRWREIGVRKVMGAKKMQIMLQTVIESVFFILASLVVAVFALYCLFPSLLELIDPNLNFAMLFEREIAMVVSIAIIVLIFLSTVVPYIQISGSSISMNLSGSNSIRYKSSLGRTLLTVQLVISIFCIAATIIVGKQLNFIHAKDLGFDRNNLIVIVVPDDFTVRKMQALKNEIERVPGVVAVSNSSFKVGGGYWKDWYTVEVDGQMKSMELYEVFSDDDLFATLKMKLVEGRLFDANNPADSGAAYVINETAAQVLGWDDPVGKRILTHPEEPGRWEGTVVGLVKDINISPLYEKVQPLVMRLPWQRDYPEYFVYVRIDGPMTKTVKAIEKKYGEILPGFPFEYDDVDTFFNSRYAQEDKAFSSLIFTTIVILIVSAVGIFSISIYLSARRMKEFGIRKVLGANGSQIMTLHLWYFIKVTLLANLIALPIAYLITQHWLSEFAYRTEVGVFTFFLVTVLSILLIVVSGSYSAWKAARLNPAEVIKMQ